MENSKMKIIFIGTPEFGAIVLEELIKDGYPPILVISSPDKPVGRKHNITPPPVKVLAEKHGIEIIQPEQIQSSKSKIQNLEPDLIVVAAYGQIIPKKILKNLANKLFCFNFRKCHNVATHLFEYAVTNAL